MDLFEQVLHAIEGTEAVQHQEQSTGRILERREFGPDRWIESAASGMLDAINFLAIVLFAVRSPQDNDRKIVEGWEADFRAAVKRGEIRPRDPVTLLPLPACPDGWDWLVSLSEADSYVASRGMEWSCTGIVEHLLSETRAAGEVTYDTAGNIVSHYWLAGHEPTTAAAPDTPEKTVPPAPEVTSAALPDGIPAAEIIEKFRLNDAWAEKLKHIARNPFLKTSGALMQQGCRKSATSNGMLNLFNPVKFAEMLIAREGKTTQQMKRIIEARFKPWQDAWDAAQAVDASDEWAE